MSKDLTFKSGSEELRKFCASADTEAMLQRFGKYTNLDNEQLNAKAAELAKKYAEELNPRQRDGLKKDLAEYLPRTDQPGV